MSSIIDPFSMGLLLGLVVGAPVFASARIAIGLLGSTAAGVMPFIITSGFEAFRRSLDAIVSSLGSELRLTVGLLIGLALAGAFSAVFRKFTNWM
jgi:hypothetical protein